LLVNCKLSKRNKTIYFFYPGGEILTGQELASRQILELLDGDGYSFVTHQIPTFERQNNRLTASILYICQVVTLWLKMLSLIFVSKLVVYVNLGQSYTALFREGLMLSFLRAVRPGIRIVISLHGNYFTAWPQSIKKTLFNKILKRANIITVLGESQKDCLRQWAIEEKNIRVTPNSAIIEPVNECDIKAKIRGKQRLQVLFLSNLMSAKGFTEYIEAIGILSQRSDIPEFNAVLCGKFIKTELQSSLHGSKPIQQWLKDKLTEINSSPKISLEWIEGAYGEEKKTLFRNSDIFVFPSRYKIEAQPIVILEAMASGCVILTSNVGLICETVSDCGIIINSTEPGEIAHQLELLLCNRTKCEKLALAGLKRYSDMFNKYQYRNNWDMIFKELTDEHEKTRLAN